MFLNNKGRTIIEMIVVVVIIAIIAAVAYPMIFMNERILNRQIKESAVRNDIRGLENFLKDDLRNSKEVGIKDIELDDNDLYSYTVTLADTDATKIIYIRGKRADGSFSLVRRKNNEKIEFTDIEELEINKDINNSRLIDVKIITLDDRGDELKHEFKVARWQWLMLKEEQGSQPGDVIDFIVNENVFVMGTKLEFKGNEILGPGATIFITQGTDFSSFNGGNKVKVSNIYIMGDYTSMGEELGSEEAPGDIIIEGMANFNSSTHIHGDVYIYGNLEIKDAKIYGNFFVNGDVKVGWTPTFNNNKKVYYTGNLDKPSIYTGENFIKIDSMEFFDGKIIPDLSLPVARTEEWYNNHGFLENGTFANNAKIFTKVENLNLGVAGQIAKNVVVVNLEGNINIDVSAWSSGGASYVSGIFFAPKGMVNIIAREVEGLIIAEKGLFYNVSGTYLIFRGLPYYTEGMEPSNVDKIFANSDEYPFVNP